MELQSITPNISNDTAQNPKLINALTTGYTSLYLVDYTNSDQKICYMSDNIPEEILAIIKESNNLDEIFHKFAESFIFPDDKATFLEAVSHEFITKKLRHEQSFFIIFRRRHGNDYQYEKLIITKANAIDDEVTTVTFGYLNIDADIRTAQHIETERLKDEKIIQALTHDYAAVYYVDLVNDTYRPYSMNKFARRFFDDALTNNYVYTESLKTYAEKSVYPADRPHLLDVATISNIKEQLSQQKSFSVLFRNNLGGLQKYCEMTFLKTNELEHEPSSVVVTFADRDAEIARQYVYKHLLSNYIAIYLTDLETDTYREILPSNIVNIKPSKGSFSKAMTIFSKTVASPYREFMQDLAQPEFMREYLAVEDRREYVYQLLPEYSTEFIWRREVSQVVERKNGIPTKVIVTFMGIDQAYAEKLTLMQKISDQKIELEEQQEELELALDRAEAASIAKSQFLSNMSHDLRTPMNAITGFVSLAMSCLDDKQQLRDYLIKASISSQHLLSLINDILDISRIESGKIQLEEAPCTIDEIINDLRTITSAQAQAKHQTLDMIIDVINHTVICDKLRLHQVLSNLLSNAVKFTPIGGKISLHVIQTISKNGSGRYEFHINDTGIGMSKDFIPKIFEAFERERTSTISKTQGTGLGMAIAKRIVDLMGGEITVESEVDKGTEFTIILYFKLAENNTISDQFADEDDLGSLDFDGKRILLAEDNELNREIAQTILENYGFIIDNAEDGLIAVEKYKTAAADTYDLVLMDIQMPNLDGYSATRAIRDYEKSSGFAPVPIIAMTANAFEEDRKKALDVGMNAHIAKPIDIPAMIRTIRKILG